jgi:hypothetical protein
MAGIKVARTFWISSLIWFFDPALQNDRNICGQQVGDSLEGEDGSEPRQEMPRGTTAWNPTFRKMRETWGTRTWGRCPRIPIQAYSCSFPS